jgi:hypothetical protein
VTSWLKWFGIGVATLFPLIAALTAYGRWRRAGLTAELVARLEAARLIDGRLGAEFRLRGVILD